MRTSDYGDGPRVPGSFGGTRPIDYAGHVPNGPDPMSMSHAVLCGVIERRADELGILWTHLPDTARRIAHRGFPDYVLSGPFGTMFREVKTTGEQPDTDQRTWGWMLRAGGEDYAIWEPKDLPTERIYRELRRIATGNSDPTP